METKEIIKYNLFKEIDNHIINDLKPSLYINEISEDKVFMEYPFKMLNDLKKTPQSPKYHPEGNVWNHTMLVLDRAAQIRYKSKDKRTFMWAALLHDLGKVPTTKIRKNRITSYDHDKVGEKLAEDFLRVFTDDEKFMYKVSKLVRWHMQPLFVQKDLPFANIDKMLNEVELREIVLLFLCDRLGRGEIQEEKINEERDNALEFIKKVKKYRRIR